MATKEVTPVNGVDYANGQWVFTWNIDNYVRGESPRPGHYSQAQLEDFVRKGQLVRK